MRKEFRCRGFTSRAVGNKRLFPDVSKPKNQALKGNQVRARRNAPTGFQLARRGRSSPVQQDAPVSLLTFLMGSATSLLARGALWSLSPSSDARCWRPLRRQFYCPSGPAGARLASSLDTHTYSTHRTRRAFPRHGPEPPSAGTRARRTQGGPPLRGSKPARSLPMTPGNMRERAERGFCDVSHLPVGGAA
jgi:hypothetical protein